MPFIVSYRGLDVHCETVEDVNRLAEQQASITAKDARRARRMARPQGPRTNLFGEPIKEASIRGLVSALKVQQRTLISEISKAERTDSELRSILNLSGNKALAGVLSGISKAAKRLKLEEVPIEKKMLRSGNGEREYRYSIRPEAAEEVQKALLNGHA